ncbi:hypothetical protein KAR91_44600 [Candidatus Pacearchaeota archaeon]|nr:hypothetical protein [Candidatus Pacearchaeota archaeon]
MDKKDTFCPIRFLSDDKETPMPCFKSCERYVKLEIGPLQFEGCAEHVQAGMLGVIAAKLAVIASEMK